MSTLTTAAEAVDLDALAAGLSHTRAEQSVRGCANPIRLTGSTVTLDTATGEVVGTYASADEPDGHTYVRCGNRRSTVCPSCSREYKGDAWHLLMCGLAGGKGVPETVADHPATFVTLTPPSFGTVHHYLKPRGGHTPACRPRRDKPTCPHGRPLYCYRRHDADDTHVGQPLCRECYDYTGHVAWQWNAPELWRYFTEYLRRHLAKAAGLSRKAFNDLCRVSYTKVVEFQARGLVHMHAIIRLDGNTGPDTPPGVALTVEQLEHAVKSAAAHVTVDTPGLDGDTLRLAWGRQIDTRTITPGAGRDNRTGPAHPEQVAAYLSKYLTKSTEDFGLPVTGKIRHVLDARKAGATDHAARIITAAQRLVAAHPDYRRLADRYATLGYRGHPITKSRAYSVTFGLLRGTRRTWRRRKARLAPDADVRDVLDTDTATDAAEDTTIVIGSWKYAGRGYLDMFDVTEAVRTATHARIRRAGD